MNVLAELVTTQLTLLAMYVCLFVWDGGRGPVLGTGSDRGIPLRDLAYAKLPGEALPWFLWDRGKGREREGRGGSANEATIRCGVRTSSEGFPERGMGGK